MLVLGPFLLLLFATHGKLFQPTGRGLVVVADTIRMRTQYQQLQQQNKQLRDSVQYLHTEAGKKLAARSELGVVAHGERLVRCLPQQAAQERQPSTFADRTQTCISRTKDAATAWLHRAGLIITVWLGTAEDQADTSHFPATPPPAP